jgi:hypothetical protein
MRYRCICGGSNTLEESSMTASRIIVLALSAGLLAGCARTPRESETPPTASRDKVQELRDSYTRSDPNVRVGVVTSVLPEERLASVGDVSLDDFQDGQGLTFIDTNGKTLTYGHIVRITQSSLHVRYNAPGPDGRAPQKGDLAVRVR